MHDTISIVQFRNEMAIASQALNRWDDYRFNNDECVRLHWLYSQDTSLASYCRQMEEAKYDSSVLLVLLAISCFVILCLIYNVFLKDRIRNRKRIVFLCRNFDSTLEKISAHVSELENLPKSRESEVIRLNTDFIREITAKRDKLLSVIYDDNYLTGVIQDFYADIINNLNKINALETDITQLTEQNYKTSFEEDRLYVMNQVLDNSLSTIKHETMYYPARIDQMAQAMQEHADNIVAVEELDNLVQYYKELYLLLYEQANRQLLQSNFRSQLVNCMEIAVYAKKKIDAINAKENKNMLFDASQVDKGVCCDKNLLKILVDNILMANKDAAQSLKVSFLPDNNIMNVLFTFGNIHKEQDELDNLFSPSKENFPYYIVRQIIREHDARYGYPGLRLVALQTEDGFTIHFSLLCK